MPTGHQDQVPKSSVNLRAYVNQLEVNPDL